LDEHKNKYICKFKGETFCRPLSGKGSACAHVDLPCDAPSKAAFVEGRGFQKNGNLPCSLLQHTAGVNYFVISIDQNAPKATMTLGTLTNTIFPTFI
jgi:hypothetical protein